MMRPRERGKADSPRGDPLLRSRWRRVGPAWILAGALYLILAITRGMALLGPWPFLLPATFIVMAASPWLLYHRAGRARTGVYGRPRLLPCFGALVAAAALAAAIVGLGDLAFGGSSADWSTSLRAQLPPAERLPPGAWATVVIILPAVTFSPIGEEFFFRGVLHEAFAVARGSRTAALANATAFAAVHLLHHGTGITGVGALAALTSAALWFGLMFAAALLFTAARAWTGSIWGAVLSHAACNVVLVLSVA